MSHFFGSKMSKQERDRFSGNLPEPFPEWSDFMGKPVPFDAFRQFLAAHPRGGGKALEIYRLSENEAYARVRQDDYRWYEFKNICRFLNLCLEHGIDPSRETVSLVIEQIPHRFINQTAIGWSDIIHMARQLPNSSPLYNLFSDIT